jgi:hypothetical protein
MRRHVLNLHASCTSGVWVSSSRLQCPTWEHCLGLSINCRCCVLGSRRSTAMCVIARICQEVPSRPGASVSNSQLCFVSHMHFLWLVSILAVIIKAVAHRSAYPFTRACSPGCPARDLLCSVRMYVSCAPFRCQPKSTVLCVTLPTSPHIRLVNRRHARHCLALIRYDSGRQHT